MILKVIIILFGFMVSFYGAEESLEYSGVMTRLPNTKKKGSPDYLVVKREINSACKGIVMGNDTLWSGNFAGEKVPEACKATFMTTAGHLLPMKINDQVETYGELEVLSFLHKMQQDKNLLLIDSRREKWYKFMTIPGAINMPFHYFLDREHYEFHFEYALHHMGVKVIDSEQGIYNFRKAKQLLVFCNGSWCSQSIRFIKALLEIGYPAQKIKWYRGGVQSWLAAGMTILKK